MLYAVDRMLDARHSAMHLQEERHHFHGVHQSAFFIALVCAVPVLLFLMAHMEPALLQAYFLLGLGMAGYFALIHSRSFAYRVPKELAVGIVFMTAIFMPELVAGMTRALLPYALSFGALCWLNCTIIYRREHSALRDAHWSTRLAIRHTSLLLAVLAATGLILLLSGTAFRTLSSSIILSALGLLALHHAQHRMDRLPFRIATDAALLTPLLFLLR
jgi:hypothetical protein